MNLSNIFSDRFHSNFWTISHQECQWCFYLLIKFLLPFSLSQIFQAFKVDFFCSTVKGNTLNTGFYINSIDILILYIPKNTYNPLSIWPVYHHFFFKKKKITVQPLIFLLLSHQGKTVKNPEFMGVPLLPTSPQTQSYSLDMYYKSDEEG